MEEACEYGLTRGTCFVARRLELVAVAGLLWISWCVLGAGGIRYFVVFFSFERTQPAASMRPPCLINVYAGRPLADGYRKKLITSTYQLHVCQFNPTLPLQQQLTLLLPGA